MLMINEMKIARVGIVFYLVVAAFAANPPDRIKSAPDVFLITIDTLRADHVHCYGYNRVETPALDSLAKNGIRFTAAFTPSPLTNTSHTTILTGLLPSTHGVTDFGIPLDPSHPTWATLLKEDGYHTGAFIGAVILDSNSLAPGLDRGFDFYDHFPEHPSSKIRWGTVERRGLQVAEHAEAWLTANPSGPRFVWVHLYDPHDPYEPPAPYFLLYKDHLYDGEIAYADSALSNFLNYLKERGWYENAIVIVVGDHGEGLGEHHENTHGIFLYDSTLHVPLIVKLPNNRDSGRVVNAQVRTTDLLPTALDLLGIPLPHRLDGRSLRAYLEGEGGHGNPALAETDYPLHFGWSPLRAMRDNGWKLIEAPRPELYDLNSDPAELKNLYRQQDAAEPRLRRMFQEMRTRMPLPAAPPGLTANALQHGSNVLQLPDPKDEIEQQNLLHTAMIAIEEGQAQEARLELRKVLAMNAQSQMALRQMGDLDFQEGHYAKAATYLGKLRGLLPSDSSLAFEYGQALAKTGDLEGARVALEEGLKINPERISAELLLGDIYLKMRNGQAAEDRFEAVLLLQPANLEAEIGVAKANLTEGDFEEALAVLKPLSKSHRENVEIWRLLNQAHRAAAKRSAVKKELPVR